MSIKFAKFHGFGNDYIVLERARLSDRVDLSDLASRICNRHTGVGADGIAVLNKLEDGEADFACEIVNPDGSIAGFSGNGTRCAVAYLYFAGLWEKPDLCLGMRTGIKNYHLLEHPSPGQFKFRAEIGKPIFASNGVPFASDEPLEDVIDREVVVGEQAILVSAINVGNPVACIYTESFDFDWRSVGREMESHRIFPERANIVFVKVIDRSNIELRIWERGAGETAASGTCSAAAAVLSAYTGRTDRTVAVHSEGGTAEIIWRADDEIVLTGIADHAFSGEFPYITQ
jgi:diaminopimelate epimerase